MNYQEITAIMKGYVCQYIKASKHIQASGYYLRQRPFSDGSKCDLYLLMGNEIKLIAYKCTWHRCKQIIKAYKDGTLQNVPEHILQNYATNGYSTRKGLFANYDTTEARIKKIGLSHRYCTESGKTGHDIRVFMRK